MEIPCAPYTSVEIDKPSELKIVDIKDHKNYPHNHLEDKSKKPAVRSHYLDSVRGLASCLVVFHHAIYAFRFMNFSYFESLKSNPFFFMMINGRYMVSVFFVLSGRVLVSSYLRKHDPAYLVSTSVRRPFRLGLPIFFAMISNYLIASVGAYLMPNYSTYTANVICKNWCQFYVDSPADPNPGMILYKVFKMFAFAWTEKAPQYPSGVLWYLFLTQGAYLLSLFIHTLWCSQHLYR